MFVWYAALGRLGVDVDLVRPGADLAGYRVVIAPTAHLMDVDEAEALDAFARAGGAVIVGVRSGDLQTDNAFTDQPLPGLLRGLIGARVLHWGALPDGERFSLASPLVTLGDGGAGLWVEALEPSPDVTVLATYRDGPWAGLAALTEQTHEHGRALYVGWYPSQAQVETILRRVLPMQGVPLDLELPAGLVLCRRGPYTILLNFTDRALTASVAGEPVQVAGRDVVIRRPPDKESE